MTKGKDRFTAGRMDLQQGKIASQQEGWIDNREIDSQPGRMDSHQEGWIDNKERLIFSRKDGLTTRKDRFTARKDGLTTGRDRFTAGRID